MMVHYLFAYPFLCPFKILSKMFAMQAINTHDASHKYTALFFVDISILNEIIKGTIAPPK